MGLSGSHLCLAQCHLTVPDRVQHRQGKGKLVFPESHSMPGQYVCEHMGQERFGSFPLVLLYRRFRRQCQHFLDCPFIALLCEWLLAGKQAFCL